MATKDPVEPPKALVDEDLLRRWTGFGLVERDARWRRNVQQARCAITRPGFNSFAHAVLTADMMHRVAGLRPYQGPVRPEVWDA